MKMKRLLSALCLVALLAGLTPALAAEEPTLSTQGWFETICAELTGLTDADVTAVTYTGEDGVAVSLEGEDFEYLVRDMDGGVRVDIPGVKPGTYSLEVRTAAKTYTAEGIEVKAYDRSGFAHQTVDENSVCTPYTEGVGAYNDDGTLKDNAMVLYVTDDNKNTVCANFSRNGDPKTIVGIGTILHSNNSKANQGILEFISREGKPLVVRFIGTVNQPQGVSAFKKGSTNGGMVQMLSGANITLEGIGPDATIKGWGFSFGADKDDSNYNKQARNFEVRNLSFKNVPEDCVEITGFGNPDGSIKEPVEHAWVHNCAFYVPDYIADAAEDDKHYGDGALDFKWGRYMTSSYNTFEGTKKTSLIGGSDTNEQYHVTWHHNWWKNCASRGPLARTADIHIYNCLYDGQTSYCMSLRANSYVFSEFNAFVNNAKAPVILEATSGSTVPVGACKSYGDDFSGALASSTNQATVVDDKTQQVYSTCKFANFDTAQGSYIAKGDYALDSLSVARAKIEAYSGAMKPLAEQGELGQGDELLIWSYDKDGTLSLSGLLPEGDQVLAGCWDADGRFAGVKVLNAQQMGAELGAGWSKVKLFWLGEGQAPKCPNEEF